ncbi:MAG: hypothetical protein SGJ18_01490 [Pseudomonadota bacterium]|nr:hypothetical protein [Pseudomonadota bacterium]
MEKGCNSDITALGKSYHVQTEDWGLKNPFIVSQIFRNGAIVKSVKNPYEKILPRGLRSDSPSIRLALRKQHQEILDLLNSGQFVL